MAVIDGTANDDPLTGIDNEADTIRGFAGDDTLSGGSGNDSLLGGAGADLFLAGALAAGTGAGGGNDTIDGGAATDLLAYLDANTVSYAGAAAAVSVNLATGIATDGGGGTDRLFHIDRVVGSTFGDTLTGSAGGGIEVFTGGAGNDRIDGGTIADRVDWTDGNRASFLGGGGVVVDLQAGTATGQGNDTLISINQVTGSDAADTLLGIDGSVRDTLEGAGGNDRLDGRSGRDVVSYEYATTGVSVDLVAGTGSAGAGDEDTLAGFEGIHGSHRDDTLAGGVAANDGFEYYRGNGGNDLIDGGSGYDRVDYVASRQAVQVTLGGAVDGSAIDGVAVLGGVVVAPGTGGALLGEDTLRGIEAVRGSRFDDTLNGSDSTTVVEVFEGWVGDDAIDGGGGTDRIGYNTFAVSGGVVVVLGLNGAAGSAREADGGRDTLRGIEDVLGTTFFADSITGNERANAFEGYGGADTLRGGAGVDTLNGGDDNDSLVGGSANDRLNGGNGNDTVDGGTGNDLLTGGSGNDLYVVDASGDKVSEGSTAAGETDAVSAAVSWTLGANLENLLLTGTVANGSGNALRNTITGNAAANQLAGAGGNDTLEGKGGADRLDGGTGSDRLLGGTGNDTYIVDVLGDQVSETSTVASERDMVRAGVTWTLGANLEDLVLTGSGAIHGTGNGAANQLTGNAAANRLTGGAGKDTLDGGAGTDTLIGGTGGDVYVVSGADVVSETSTLAGEIDTVRTGVSYVLGSNLEQLTLLGTAGLQGVGNTAANTLTGNSGGNRLVGLAGADRLVGNAGADTLEGGTGNDTLIGGSGADIFRFNTPLDSTQNADRIEGFSSLDDTIEISRGIVTGMPAGGLSPTAFRVGPTSTTQADRVIYDSATGRIWFDPDGIGEETGEGGRNDPAQLIAMVTPGTALSFTDFVFV